MNEQFEQEMGSSGGEPKSDKEGWKWEAELGGMGDCVKEINQVFLQSLLLNRGGGLGLGQPQAGCQPGSFAQWVGLNKLCGTGIVLLNDPLLVMCERKGS